MIAERRVQIGNCGFETGRRITILHSALCTLQSNAYD